MTRPVAFLFLGETLLIPHLYPIVEALAEAAPELPIDLWVSTSVHEALIGGWLADAGIASARIRRAPGYRRLAGYENGRNPPLPAKLPMLFRLAPRLNRAAMVVSAEQTSLWLPRVLPMRPRFINVLHGAGSMMTRGDKRRKAAWKTLVPGEGECEALAAHGVDPGSVVAIGYVKAAFRHRTATRPPFAEERPIVLYAPHWQQHRSSWWEWGERAIETVLASDRYNLIFAPHQRLAEKAPEVREMAARIADRADVHCDLDSFAMVDGSYTAAADLYLGDTSSQVVEFLMRPRPCVFLDPLAVKWAGDPSYAMWAAGEVVTDVDALDAALERAPAWHSGFVAAQRAFAEAQLGDISGAAAARAARLILDALA
ncbi:MAG TPA: hypothetical protein VM657_13675 [Sphingomonas sp.]|nr:hypothetical protein [Sphingomonas sp.]